MGATIGFPPFTFCISGHFEYMFLGKGGGVCHSHLYVNTDSDYVLIKLWHHTSVSFTKEITNKKKVFLFFYVSQLILLHQQFLDIAVRVYMQAAITLCINWLPGNLGNWTLCTYILEESVDMLHCTCKSTILKLRKTNRKIIDIKL